MTEAEAIKFLQSWRRLATSGEKLSIGEVISIIRRACFRTMTIGALLILLPAIHNSTALAGFRIYLQITELVLGLAAIGYSIWSLIRLRQAGRLLNYATDGSSRPSSFK